VTLILIWLTLVLLLGLEVLVAILHAGWVAFGLAPIMVALVAGGFMHVLRASTTAHIFAAAGVFWLLILLSLGGLDFFARNNYPAPVMSPSSISTPNFGGTGEPGANLSQSHLTAPRP
jgi:cytochrome c oxidase subunit IV